MKETIELKGDEYDDAITTMKRLGITRMTLTAWGKEGLPAPIKLGRRLYFNRRDVDNYLLRSK